MFRDDFTTLNTSKYFWYPAGWYDTSKRGQYSGSSRVSVANGLLDIHLGTDSSGPRSIAFVPQLTGGQEILYGKFEVRFMADSAAGWKTAWLLWPQVDANWPKYGEIDFPEGSLNSTIEGFVHLQGATSGSDQNGYSTSARYTSWHTAVIEWTPAMVRFTLDGVVIGTTTSRIPAGKMHVVYQSESTIDNVLPAASAHIYMDYVQIWAYTP